MKKKRRSPWAPLYMTLLLILMYLPLGATDVVCRLVAVCRHGSIVGRPTG